MSTQRVTALFLNKLPYVRALKVQQYFTRAHLDYLAGDSRVKPKNVILLQEHDPVYTIGLRSDGYSREEEARLRALGAEFHRTNRGGLITFHGPGQLVAYPIINLKDFNLGMRQYVCELEHTVIKLCQRLDIEASTSPDTGVWVNNNKLAAIGVHGRRYVTSHGVGLNCNTDLSWFSHIVPCGIQDKGVTSLSRELNRDVTIGEATPLFLDAFAERFGCAVTLEEKTVENTEELLENIEA